jgi:hypothetical protein
MASCAIGSFFFGGRFGVAIAPQCLSARSTVKSWQVAQASRLLLPVEARRLGYFGAVLAGADVLLCAPLSARMPDSPSEPVRVPRSIWPVALPAIVALAYAVGHLAWYRHTPLGQVPVLDEQDNLVFAEGIVRRQLPAEPFYRAPGYPLLLALLRVCGVSTSGLFSAALILGAGLHALNAALVARTACCWFSKRAALIAGLLCALHPVFVHYATQALDAVPATTLFLGGMALLAPLVSGRSESPPTWWRWAAPSGCWAIATIMRPNYLLVWCMLPVLALWWMRGPWRGRWLAGSASLAGVAVFVAVAAWQHAVSGVAGFLPWQGAYNLWAANEPGTHGRYYLQRHTPPPSAATLNPARADSFYLFHQAKGVVPANITELNGYWRVRFWEQLRADPLAWLQVLGRKTYALLNNWEQYNNKTFAFHQARSPWLRWNPLGWGVLFVLGVAGTARLVHTSPRSAVALALIAGSCAASILLFFVSARFRLPHAALLTILAGGALGEPHFWRTWSARAQLALAISLVMAATLTFSRFDHVADRATFVEDHALIARAASTLDDNAAAWAESVAALTLNPKHPDARFVAVASYFNLLVQGQADVAAEPRWLEICQNVLAAAGTTPRNLQAVAAVALWRAGEHEVALSAWRRLGATASAVGARLLAGDSSVTPRDLMGAAPAAWNEPLVGLAAAYFRLPVPEGVPPKDRDRALEIIQRLFGRTTAARPPR